MTFPLIGSAVLLGLFLLFKFLPQHLVNTVLTAYFVLIGIFAITVTISPFMAPLFPQASRERVFKLPSFSIPYLLEVTPFIPSPTSSSSCGSCLPRRDNITSVEIFNNRPTCFSDSYGWPFYTTPVLMSILKCMLQFTSNLCHRWFKPLS